MLCPKQFVGLAPTSKSFHPGNQKGEGPIESPRVDRLKPKRTNPRLGSTDTYPSSVLSKLAVETTARLHTCISSHQSLSSSSVRIAASHQQFIDFLVKVGCCRSASFDSEPINHRGSTRWQLPAMAGAGGPLLWQDASTSHVIACQNHRL